LLEPLAQPQEILATFLWRAPEGTAEQPHHVRLDWPIRSSEPFQLQRLAGTDIWHISVPLPRGMRAAYPLVVNPVHYPAAVGQVVDRFERAQVRQLTAQRDALNPHMWHAGSPELPSGPAALHAHRSVLDLATGMGLQNQATDQVWPPLAGSLQHLQFHSRQLGNTRSLSLYLPPGSHAQASLPLLILFDREAYLERVQLPQRLERWVAQGQIQPHALLLVSNPTRDHRAKELPPHSPAFGQMLSTELMPWLYAQQPALARDASQVTVAGSSYGGLTAAYLAWSHPESFGKVLSLSGSFWWSPTPVNAAATSRWSEGDWFMQQVARSPIRAVQWHLSYGQMERGAQGSGGLVDNNRHLRNVLQAKGYPVSSDEFVAGHDYYAWGDALLRGLQALQIPPSAPESLSPPP
jgi:enterochelin esterase-like enzyme